MKYWVFCSLFLLVVGLVSEQDGYARNLNSSSQRTDRIYGMLMGGAVADALAGPHEGRSTEDSQAFLEDGGWIDSFDTPYSRWYQTHWNVYEQGAEPGTYTDDTRLRLFVAESLADFHGRNSVGRLYLANRIFESYEDSRIRFVNANKDVLKERFLEMSFWWELSKLASSVKVPKPPIYSPPSRREELLDEQSERTGYWKLVKVEPEPVQEDIKIHWHDGSYAEGKEWPIGLITLPPVACYAPGNPKRVFTYALELNFLDIGNAPMYSAVFAALLADGLGGADWPTVRERLVEEGLRKFLDYDGSLNIELLDTQVQSALKLSRAFGTRADYHTRDNYLEFVKALHEAFAVGTEYDMCTCEEMFSVSLALADYSMGLGLQTAVEYGVNYGRDNDTVASLAASLVGAYRGADDLDPDWITLVQKQNPSVDIRELSEGLSFRTRTIY